MGGTMVKRGGAFRPAPISCRYSRVPHDLIAEAHANGMPNIWAVLLMLSSYISEHGGALYVCCSRHAIANALGLTDRQVGKAIDTLKAKGIIETARKGGNGRAAVYRLAVGTPDRGCNSEVGAPDRGCNLVGTPSGGVATQTEVGPNSWYTFWRGSNSEVGTPSRGVPNRTSKEVLYRESSLGDGLHSGNLAEQAPNGPAPVAPVYPPPRVIRPVSAAGGDGRV